MPTKPKTRFFIVIEEVETEVFPTYDGGGTNLDQERESGQVFFRDGVSGRFRLGRSDGFELVFDAAGGTKYTFLIKQTYLGIETTRRTGYFYRQDCEIDEDERWLEFEPIIDDVYTDFLSGLDKEFNLIDLAPAITPVTILRRPIFQMYIPGQDYLTNFIGSNYWEQPVTVPESDIGTLQSTYFFGLAKAFIFIPGAGDLDPDVGGEYDNSTLRRLDDVYRIEMEDLSPNFRYNIYRNSDDVMVYQGQINVDFSETTYQSQTSASQCRSDQAFVMMRFLTNQEDVGGTPTEDRPTDDIVGENSNYTKILPIIAHNAFTPYDGHQAAPTRYGKFDEAAMYFGGEYFQKYTVSGSQTFPVSRSNWFDYSLWFYYTPALLTLQAGAEEEVVIRDAFKLVDVIKAFLAVIAPDLSHEESSAYSDYLYGASNSIRGTQRHTIICPKSNLLKGNYDQPATRAQLKFSEVLDMIWSVLRGKWYIANDGKFIVEHIHYFENGKSYSSPVVGIDATTLTDPKTGLAWAYGTNRYKTDKSGLPERLEFSWMEDVSPAFMGQPIQVNSQFVQRGNIETNAANRFNSDVDFMLANVPNIALDGFALLEAELDGDQYIVPVVDFTDGADMDYSLQNGYLAFAWLHENIHIYNLPALDVNINGADTSALSVRRKKIQEVILPFGVFVDPMQLITTGLGNAEFTGLQENIDNGTINATLAHDTES